MFLPFLFPLVGLWAGSEAEFLIMSWNLPQEIGRIWVVFWLLILCRKPGATAPVFLKWTLDSSPILHGKHVLPIKLDLLLFVQLRTHILFSLTCPWYYGRVKHFWSIYYLSSSFPWTSPEHTACFVLFRLPTFNENLKSDFSVWQWFLN